MKPRRFGFFLLGTSVWLASIAADAPHDTAILQAPWPRTLFFRRSEADASRGQLDYRAWAEKYSRLDGIIGKALDEEISGRSATLPFFTRFKAEYPAQTVLIHINGNARLPDFEAGEFFAGHWLYFNGVRVLDALPASGGQATVRVSDPALFDLQGGRYHNAPDDIGLCALDAAGKPDWREAEQVQLVAVDRAARTITIRRGCYGTKPRAFPAGRAYAAAHVFEGPWGREGRSHTLWRYNYATTCPRDREGRSAADVWARQLGRWFGPRGRLAPFDGLEFDSTFFAATNPAGKRRGADCDADGRRDDGVIDGINVYGIGFIEFCRELRRELGPARLILADGALDHDRSQRASGVLNGIESEGFPELRDPTVGDWSGGLNRHDFWRKQGAAPAISYINHKFIRVGEKPTAGTNLADVPWNIHRLVFAAALFTDTALTASLEVPAEKPGAMPIWDEWVGGREQRKGWLGFPLEPARHLALQAPQLLPAGRELEARLQATGATVKVEDGRILLKPKDRATIMTLRVKDVETRGPDLLVRGVIGGAALPGYPGAMARLLHVRLVPAGGEPDARMAPMAWAGTTPSPATFYFDRVPAAKVDLLLSIEGPAPVEIAELAAHAAPDLMSRAYDHGLVVANPGSSAATFDLTSLYPGKRFRRLRATSGQDAAANDGQPVGATITLGPKDARFLIEAPR